MIPGFPTDKAKDRTGLHPLRPLLRQSQRRSMSPTRAPGDATDQTQERRSREMDSVERDLVARLYVAGGPDRRHVQCPWVGFPGDHHRPAQPHRRGQRKRDGHALCDNLDQQRLGRQWGPTPTRSWKITDALGDTSLPTNEFLFSVFDGPQAGLRYGGVAFAAAPEPSTWAMLLLGFAGPRLRGLSKAVGSVTRLIKLASTIRGVASWRLPQLEGRGARAAGTAQALHFRDCARSRPAGLAPIDVIASANTPARRACRSRSPQGRPGRCGGSEDSLSPLGRRWSAIGRLRDARPCGRASADRMRGLRAPAGSSRCHAAAGATSAAMRSPSSASATSSSNVVCKLSQKRGLLPK